MTRLAHDPSTGPAAATTAGVLLPVTVCALVAVGYALLAAAASME